MAIQKKEKDPLLSVSKYDHFFESALKHPDIPSAEIYKASRLKILSSQEFKRLNDYDKAVYDWGWFHGFHPGDGKDVKIRVE